MDIYVLKWEKLIIFAGKGNFFFFILGEIVNKFKVYSTYITDIRPLQLEPYNGNMSQWSVLDDDIGNYVKWLQEERRKEKKRDGK